MKLPQTISRARGALGMMLLECLVYISVFAILLGGATAVFYFCWDHSDALIYTSNDIASSLHAGERWRADVRAATGKITIETNAAGEVARIPEGARTIFYHFESGEVRRQISYRAIRNCCWLMSGRPKWKWTRAAPSAHGAGNWNCSRVARKRTCR